MLSNFGDLVIIPQEDNMIKEIIKSPKFKPMVPTTQITAWGARVLRLTK